MRTKSQAGYSITEVLVATVVISVVAYSILTAFPALKKQASSFRNVGSCRAYLDRSFAELEENGFRPKIPAGTDTRGVTVNILPTFTLNGKNVSPLAGQRAIGQGAGDWTNSDQLSELRTPGLVVGTSALVNKLYNDATSACGTDTTYSGTGLSPFPAPPDDMKDGFALKVAIAPYDIQTRTEACGNAKFTPLATRIPGPKGFQNTDPATGLNSEAERVTAANPYAPNGIAKFSGSVNPDLAFLVTLTAEFDVKDSTGYVSKKSCRETRVVNYTSDLARPSQPTISITYSPGVPSYPQWGADSASLVVRHNGEPGVALFCRDYSGYFTPTPPSNVPGKMYAAALIPAPRPNRWVPCEKVTMCGVNNGPGTGPSNGGTAFVSPGPGPMYEVSKDWTYPSFPVRFGCIARIAAIAVDMAGNVSLEATASLNIDEGPPPAPPGPPPTPTPGPGPINGLCGGANGVAAAVAPTAGLCNAGTASAVSGSGPWTWTCNGSGGGTNASCSTGAVAAGPGPGACGTANNSTVAFPPTTGLCASGTATAPVFGWGIGANAPNYPITWDCVGTTTVQCKAASAFTWSHCFVAGTQVTLKNGKTKSIEEIQVGEEVQTYDEYTREMTSSPVEEIFHHEEKPTVLFTFHYGNKQVTSNDQHRMYLPREDAYYSAAEVYEKWQRGEKIYFLSASQREALVTNIEMKHDNVKLYNLHVKGRYDGPRTTQHDLLHRANHNYFANGVLAHNVKWCGGMSVGDGVQTAVMSADSFGPNGNDVCQPTWNVMKCAFQTAADQTAFYNQAGSVFDTLTTPCSKPGEWP